MRLPFLLLTTIISLLANGSYGIVAPLEPRQAASCSPISSALSKLRSLDRSSAVSTACSSLLSYSRGTQTVRTTVTRTQTNTVATTTSVSTRTRTSTIFSVRTIETTQTQLLTVTVASFKYETITQTSAYGGAAKERRQAAATPTPLNLMNVPLSLLSRACSCYVPSPTRAVTTRTATTTVIRPATAVVKRTTTSLTTRTVQTTATNLDVIGVYTYVTEYPDSTLIITVTTCRGTNPTPSFGLQVVDTTPTRTDSYNNLYATPTPNPGFGEGFCTLDFLAGAQGRTFNIDCLGRLFVAAPGGGTPLFANVAYLSPGFEVVYFSPQAEIEKREYIYIYCSAAGTFLNCRVPQPEGVPELTMFLTCPLYEEFYDTPLVISNEQSVDAPVCYGLQFRKV